ncbi:hypothetical protein [Agrococcus sp. ProA11]|uniref:hypothetical protein n=1 Tax=Agrococcus chionoecetis TaxID=3153752 RepID=UPI003260AEB8
MTKDKQQRLERRIKRLQQRLTEAEGTTSERQAARLGYRPAAPVEGDASARQAARFQADDQ